MSVCQGVPGGARGVLGTAVGTSSSRSRSPAIAVRPHAVTKARSASRATGGAWRLLLCPSPAQCRRPRSTVPVATLPSGGAPSGGRQEAGTAMRSVTFQWRERPDTCPVSSLPPDPPASGQGGQLPRFGRPTVRGHRDPAVVTAPDSGAPYLLLRRKSIPRERFVGSRSYIRHRHHPQPPAWRTCARSHRSLPQPARRCGQGHA